MRKKLKIFLSLIAVIIITFFSIVYIREIYFKHRYVEKCYFDNKHSFEIITNFFKEQYEVSVRKIKYDQKSHTVEKCYENNSQYINCSNENFDKVFSELRDEYQHNSKYNVFSFARANYDDSGNMLLYFVVKSEKIEDNEVRNYYLVYIDDDYKGHGSELAIDNSDISAKEFSKNWYYWSKDIPIG